MFGIFKVKGEPKYAEPVNKILQQMDRYPDKFSVKAEEYRRSVNGVDDHLQEYTHIVELKDNLSGYCFRLIMEESSYYVPFNNDHVERFYRLEDHTGVEWADGLEARALYIKAQDVIAHRCAMVTRELGVASFNAAQAARNSVMGKYFQKG